MSRPFPDTFEDGRSPLTPLSGGPPQSISYQANVNRRKTKKWADAKPVSYGGDDWGDEYDDEYDAASPPQEMPKPTGYRQPGQAVGGLQQPAGNYKEGRKPYGDLPGGQQIGADRSATVPRQMHRNSFGEDDERRAFSSGPAQIPPQVGQRTPQLYVQTQQQPQQTMGGFRGSGPQPMETPPIQAPGAFPETLYSVHESQRSYMGEQNQQQYQQPYQQFQPVSPVNARGIPIQPGYGRNASPVSAGRAASAGSFTPRKSSLSQGSGSEMGYGSQSRERSEEPAMKPWPGPGVASPGGTAPPTTAKALPFVRPADIYKRLEEERTKERQSMESGRPSMDSIVGERGREMSPTAAPPSSAIPPLADQYTRGRSGSQSDSYGVTDSGRRLGQSLEPVPERKSEYSFMDTSTRSPEAAQKLEDIKRTESPYQPYRKQSPEDAPKISYNDTPQHADEPENDSSFASEETEKHRRFSTSPKLPDLNRLSGFGFDMWGAKPEEPAPEPARPVVAPLQPAVKTEEQALREKPSQGFNSVVHQAFDRNDSFSDARDPQRTDSETSIGTSDISPINTRAAFISNDHSTPMITEESEPNSRRGSGHITPKQEVRPETPQQTAPFLPGHRRDLSAPIGANSRDKSPARTPVVKQSTVVGPGVQVHIAEPSEASPNSPTADEEQQIEDAARYERYPRPPIPGGWTSYATTAGESVHISDEPNMSAPADTSKIAPFTAEIIASNPLPDEFSPTIAAKTEEIRPPSPEVTPVIQPPAADEHSPFVAKQMDNMAPPSPAAEHAPETKAPDAFSPSLAQEMDIVALPTPDPHMGPIGNPYSLAAVDPRIDSHTSQPETPGSSKSADTITGLAPPAIHEPGVSPGSSVGPTPPPKDTPRMPGFGESEYFPPPVPLKPKTAEEVAAAEGLQLPQRPGMVPTLSTSTMPYDDENDKLRKEIVKSLSPRQSLSGPSHAPHQQGQSMLGVAEQGAPRESMYLPSEYDSYWGATDDEPSQYSQPSQTTPVKQQPQDVTVHVQAASPSSEDAATPPIPPLNPKRVSRTSMGSIPGITHEPRYSFDQGQERRLSTDNRSDVSAPSAVAAPTADNKQWTRSLAGNGSAKGRLPVDLQRADSASPAPLSIRSAKTDKTDKNSEVSGVSSEKPKEDDSPAQGILGMAAAAGAAVAATLLPIGGPSAEADDKPDTPRDTGSERHVPSLQGVVVDEDDRITDKALSAEVSPVSAMSPTQELPAMMNVVSPPSATVHQPQSSVGQSAMLPSPLNISRPTTAQTNHSGVRAAQQNQPPPMQFREIMSMQTPEMRIDAYNKARAQYASMDSGLANWLAAQTGQAPHTPPHYGQEGRSRAGSTATPAPYYQQYLNASGKSPAVSAGTPVSNMGTPQRQSTLGMMGTQSSFGGRSTSHQAQQQAQAAKEKGKELLHSAGVFGGAVGKKGKGLFKKSTSRWLGGGGDKQETPPITPHKDPNYTPSVRSASFTSALAQPAPQFPTPGREGSFSAPSQALREQSPASSGRRGPYPDLGPQPSRESPRPTPPYATPQQSQTLREQSPASSGRRGPYPDLGPAPSQESPRATPTKRRTSWLPHFGSHSGRPPSRGKDTPKRSASHDITSMLRSGGGREHREQRQGSFDGGHRFRPGFFHHRSDSQATPSSSFSGQQYASPQNSFGPGAGVQYASPQGSYMGTPGTRQRSDSLPLPPGVTVYAREVSSVVSSTPPPVAPQIHLDLPETRLRDEHWLRTSPANTASPHISAANSSQSPHPSSRHHSGVPSVAPSATESEKLEARDAFDKDKELPSLLHVQDDHEHTGVKPPVPIGKYQPSWDPFNATPIQEEREGSEYSFGAGKISPPKLSPPNLESVQEGKVKEVEGNGNAVLAGVAGMGLAAGAATTAGVVADQIEQYKEEQQERKIEIHTMEIDEEDLYDASGQQVQGSRDQRKTEVNTTEIDGDDLYDASPPPKSKRRSMDLRPAVPVGLAAAAVTSAGTIHEQVLEQNDNGDMKDEEDEDWEYVQHADAPENVERDEHAYAPVKDEESYFPPITEQFTTATPPQAYNQHSDAPKDVETDEPGDFPPTTAAPQPYNARLDLDSRTQSRGHSRDISSVSAVSAMTGTGTPGEIVQAEEITLARQPSPTERQIPQAPPTIQSIVHGTPWTPDDDTPGDEDLQTFTPPRAGFIAQPAQNTLQSIVHGTPWTPDDDDDILTPPRPGFMGEPSQRGQSTPTMEGLPGFFPSTPSVSEAPGSIKESFRTAQETNRMEGMDKPLPPIDKELPYEHPDDISNKATPTLLSSQPLGGPDTIDRTAWEAVTSEITREDTPSAVSEDEDDEKPYAAALARLDNVRNNTQLIGDESRQRSFEEAERLRAQNKQTGETAGVGVAVAAATTGQVISEQADKDSASVASELVDDEKPYAEAMVGLDNVTHELQRGTVQSREPVPRQRAFDGAERFRSQNAQTGAQSNELEPRQRSFDEAEKFRLHNAHTAENAASGPVAWTPMTSQVIAERKQDNSPSIVSDEDDEKPYVARESEPRQRAFYEADKFRAQNARIIEKAGGGAAAGAATTSSVSEEDDEDDEKPYVMTLARLDNVRSNKQQIGNEVQPQQGMVQSRESEPRQRSFNEAEQFRAQNVQAVNEDGAKVDRKSEGNGVLAGAAGLGLAAGAATTAHVIAEQVQDRREERQLEVNTTEVDEDDIYDASPPPKSKRRSMDLRPAVSLGPSNVSLPPPGPIQGAVGQRDSPRGVTPALEPQPERDLVPSEFTPRTASTASSVQPPPVLAQERTATPRSPLGAAPVQQQRQFSPPLHHDQAAYRHSASQIVQAPYNQLPQGQRLGPPRLQHEDAVYGGKTPEVGVRDSWFKRLPMHQQQRMSQPPPQQQQLTSEERMFQQHQGIPPPAAVAQPQQSRHGSTAIAQQETMRETQSPVVFIGPLPPPGPIPAAVPQRGSPTGVTPVLAPQQGHGPVPSEFTPRTGTAASSIPQAPPVLAQERTITPRSALGAAPVQQQRQFAQPIPQNQNKTAHQQSADHIGGTPYNGLSQGPPPGPPRGQHQAYAQQLAQGPPQLKKTNSDANRHVLQKRPSSATSSQKGKEVKEKKKSWLSGLLGSRRKSAMSEKEKDTKYSDPKVPLVAVLGATGMAAQHQLQSPQNEERQRYSLPQPQQQMSGAVPPQGQQFDTRDPGFLQWQQQRQQEVQRPPGGPQRQLQGVSQPQQQYASPPIPGPYAYVRGDGSYGPVNHGPMILNPHQQQQAAGFRQSQQPVFADQRSYDEYMRQQQAAQAQQQGHYASLPPPPAQSYYQGTQESVPPNFRRASQEYVSDLNQRSSQEYSRRESNPMAGGQQLNPTYTQQQASQRPQSQRNEPIAVAIPAWKRAIRDTPGATSPVKRSEPEPPVLGPQGDFPHLAAYNPNSNKTPDTPEPQGHLRPFLGLNDGRRNSNLSTEDLLARSPARAQFGQQAPYQLSLPGGDDDDELDSPHSRRSPPNALIGVVAGGAAAVASGAAAAAGHTNSRQSASSPFRESHQQQASNVPVPETAFSPIADRGGGLSAGEIPPPPIPKWSAPPTPSGVVHNVQLGHPTHHSGVGLLQPAGQPLLHQQGQMLSPNIGVGRSNTVMSDVSSVTVDSRHTPSPRQNAAMMGGAGQGHGHKKSISAASPIMGQQLSQVTTRDSVSPRSSPNDTPIVGNAMSVQPIRPSVAHHRTEPVVQRIHIPSDIRSPPLSSPQEQQTAPPMPTARAPSPPHAPVPAANATGGLVVADDRARAERPTVLTQHPDHSGLIYDNSREGLIVVEDATVRRVNEGQAARTPEDDEAPVMSATSFPGDEWRPYGWDDGGFD